MNPVRPLVLLVDDHADTRELYELALPYEGFRVVVASDVEHARRYVMDQPPDVVITDLSMPGTNGCEFTEWLHSRMQPRVPVIALTAWAGPTEAARAREAGCTTVCVKPCLPDVLAATIRAVLGAQGVRE